MQISPAEACCKIAVGDELVSVNGVKLSPTCELSFELLCKKVVEFEFQRKAIANINKDELVVTLRKSENGYGMNIGIFEDLVIIRSFYKSVTGMV